MSNTIIIDAGSSRVRAGFGDDDGPRVTVSSSVLGASPMTLGAVTDVGGWTALMRHILANELKVDPTGCNFFLTTAASSPTSIHEQVVKVLFDTFGAAGVALMSGAACALMSQGIENGVVAEVGHETLTIVPVYGSNVLPGSLQRIPLGGRLIDQYLQTLLAQRGVSVDLKAARALKEGLGYVVQDEYEDESNAYQGEASMSVDGTTYTLGRERFRSAECLFDPTRVGVEWAGMADMTYDAIQKSDMELRKGFFGNIVLAGGGSLFPGLPERFQTDVARRAPIGTPPRVVAPADRDVIAWKGGRGAAAKLTADSWTSRADYAANPAIVRMRCIGL